MPTHRPVTRRGLRRAPLLTFLVLPTGLAAQEATSRPRTLCWDGAPLPACATFLVTEVQGVLPLLRSTRSVRWSPDYPIEETPYEERLQWELGLMHNVSEDWAVGGAVRLGAGSTDVLTGLTARARRWLAPDLGLDVSAGAIFLADNGPGHYGRATGLMADARLNFGDDVYAGVRFEEVSLDPFRGSDGSYDPGGRPVAASILLGLGSEWAVGGSAVLGAALLLLLATVDWD